MIPAAQPNAPTPATSGPEILIVEDSKPVTRALAKLLSSHGMRPVVCFNAADALAHAQQSTPAAAVIDIHLPDQSGLLLTQQLRSRFGERTPIIIVSGDGSREVLSSLSHVGATYFFSKPVNAKALVEKLQGLLS